MVLGGCPATGYTAPVQVDGQTVQLIVDTGSTDLAVALSSCANCDTEATVNPTNGVCGTTPESSFYGDGSGWNGDKCTSTVQVGGEVPAVSMSFAGITQQSHGFFRDQDCSGNTVAKSPADGIIGFGPLDIDDIGHHPADAYFQELATQGIANAFSVLLCTQGGGDMWFGGYDESFTDGSAPQFTGIVGGGFWNVDLTSYGLGVGTNAIDLGGGDSEALVDTGTELLYMAPTAFSALTGDLANNSGVTSVFGSGVINRNFFNQLNCATPTGNQTRAEVDAALPPLTLTFPNVSGGGTFTIALPATQSYLSASGSGASTQYCAAAASSGSSQTGNTILGDSVLGSHITIFDIGQHQIGFVPQNTCN